MKSTLTVVKDSQNYCCQVRNFNVKMNQNTLSAMTRLETYSAPTDPLVGFTVVEQTEWEEGKEKEIIVSFCVRHWFTIEQIDNAYLTL